jgi:amino acid transporter
VFLRAESWREGIIEGSTLESVFIASAVAYCFLQCDILYILLRDKALPPFIARVIARNIVKYAQAGYASK